MNAAEYRAQSDWLRLNPHDPQAQFVRRALRAYEREQQAQGVDVAAVRAAQRLTHGYVAFFHDRPGQPLAGKVIHADRYCQHIAGLPDEDVRDATADERERLGTCGTCG